jgi:hypothetical protein
VGALLQGAGIGLGGERGQALQQIGNQLGGGDTSALTPNVAALNLAALPAAGTGRPTGTVGGTGCPETLGYFASRVPHFKNYRLAVIRDEFLKQNVPQTIQRAKAQGLSAQAAIQAAHSQAREHDTVVRQGAACTADVDAWGSTDEQFLSRINNNQYTNLSCEGVRGSCLCSAIMNKIGAVGARAMAGAMGCFASKGKW